MHITYRQCAGQQRTGTVATEFALTIPVLLLMALGAMDFGRVSYYAEVVSNAARTGAERGAVERFTDLTRSAWEADIREAVVDEMQNLPDFSEEHLDYSLEVSTDRDGVTRHVAVEVAYPFHTIVSWPALPAEIRLRDRIQFRQFR